MWQLLYKFPKGHSGTFLQQPFISWPNLWLCRCWSTIAPNRSFSSILLPASFTHGCSTLLWARRAVLFSRSFYGAQLVALSPDKGMGAQIVTAGRRLNPTHHSQRLEHFHRRWSYLWHGDGRVLCVQVGREGHLCSWVEVGRLSRGASGDSNECLRGEMNEIGWWFQEIAGNVCVCVCDVRVECLQQLVSEL